ncbi:MAG: redox-sensing transcriptional repressor Rex [Ruminococcaceae bacterium]|nr:redox-sensing transcriptional repressor Rex [Oscillospiraceae bacterium]
MIQEKREVPLVVVKRLPRYYRYLGELLRKGITRISSGELSKRMGVTASQIRQDFNCFGGFGQQGYGYNVEKLHREIANILGLSHGYKTIIIGAGHLGHALANHTNFAKRGFELVGIFDKKPELAGKVINDLPVLPMEELEEFCNTHQVNIAILALPKSAIIEVVPRLVALGIKGLWNFSYTDIAVPEDVAVENVHLSDSLMTLSYKITEKQKQGDA